MIYIQLRSTGLLPFVETVEHLDATTTLESVGLNVDSSHKSPLLLYSRKHALPDRSALFPGKCRTRSDPN